MDLSPGLATVFKTGLESSRKGVFIISYPRFHRGSPEYVEQLVQKIYEKNLESNFSSPHWAIA